jgi:hypothetical protein
VTRKRSPDAAANVRIGDVLSIALDLEGGDALEVDRAELMAEDDRIAGLAGTTLSDRYLARIPGCTR